MRISDWSSDVCSSDLPGRALSAEYSSLIVRVERRRGDELYINDGAYGALFDAAHIGWRFPVRLLREEESEIGLEEFSFSGPTRDEIGATAGRERVCQYV